MCFTSWASSYTLFIIAHSGFHFLFVLIHLQLVSICYQINYYVNVCPVHLSFRNIFGT